MLMNLFENNNVNISYPNFTLLVNNMEDDYEEDWEPPLELLRLVEQEARELKPHQEDVELIDLGDENEKKEVKIGTGMTKEI